MKQIGRVEDAFHSYILWFSTHKLYNSILQKQNYLYINKMSLDKNGVKSTKTKLPIRK